MVQKMFCLNNISAEVLLLILDNSRSARHHILVDFAKITWTQFHEHKLRGKIPPGENSPK
jgi:hypothetical protein